GESFLPDSLFCITFLVSVLRVFGIAKRVPQEGTHDLSKSFLVRMIKNQFCRFTISDSIQFQKFGVLRSGFIDKIFQNFEFKTQFFATKNCAQIELPELPGEAPRRPALIEIDDKFHSDRPPQIRQRNICADRTQPDIGVEGKELALVDETIERIAVEGISMGRIGGPI